MNKIVNTLYVIFLAVVLVSCSQSTGYKKKLNVPYQKIEPQEVEIIEYNKAVFAIDTAHFEEGIQAIRPRFQALLGEQLGASEINYLKEFATDTFILKINELVEETFPNIEVVSDKVKGVYQHIHFYYPEVVIPPTYTYISGVSYENGPIMIGPECVMISLDYYLSNNDLVYDKIGMPRYISRRCQPASLTKDLAEIFYYTFFYKSSDAPNVLSKMIERGKKYYFIEAMDPSLPDSIILGYSARQTEWVHDNEGLIWASIVGNNMLYDNSFEQQRLLFNDGPFTAAFSEDAPSRLGEYFGLQIIRSYMSHNDDSLQNLLQMTDYQDILQRSRYKPRK